MVYYSMFLFVWFAFAGGTGLMPVPCSVPPLPEDPRLLAVAPADALAFVSWAGTAAVDPATANRTERLVAEPAVRKGLQQLQHALLGMLGRHPDEQQAQQLRRLGQLLADGLQRPGCAFIGKMSYAPERTLSGGVLLQAGPELAVVREMIVRLGGEAGPQANLHQDMVVDGVTFHALPVARDKPFVGCAAVDEWLLLAVGDGTPASMLAGLRGAQQGLGGAAQYQKLAAACKVERPATRSYLDLAGLRRLLDNPAGQPMSATLELLGLGKATAALSVSGLEGKGWCSRLRVQVPAAEGLLGAVTGAPLSQDELALIPLDAELALSCRIDAGKVIAALDRFAGAMGAPPAVISTQISEGGRQLGVDLQADLIGQFGDQLTIWSSPEQGSLWFTGLTAALPVRDVAAVDRCLDAMFGAMQEMMPARGQPGQANRRGHVERLKIGEHKGWWLDTQDHDMFVAPSFLTGEQHLFASLIPQSLHGAVASAAEPRPDRSLVQLPEINRRGNASVLFHLDLRRLMQTAYPFGPILLAMSSRDLEREGFDLPVTVVPPLPSLLPHLGREITLLEAGDGHVTMTRSGTWPSADPLLIALAAGFGVALAD